MDAVGAAKPQWFTSLDLSSGYFQQAIHESSIKYSGFMFNRKTYALKTCPQGLNSSPFLFQKLMNTVLEEELNTGKVFAYLDDVLICNATLEGHMKSIKGTLEAIKRANLKLGGAKCHFAQQEMDFLGYRLTPEGITIAKKHTEALATFPTPKSASQIKSYVGIINYFKSWIPNRGKLLAPLNALTRMGVKFVWNEACQSSFDQLREILTTHPVLAFPDFTRPFVVATDASMMAIGAVLCQPYGPQQQLRPIAFLGRATTPQEQKWSVTEQEALACVYAVTHWDVYLTTFPFKLVTDHKPLSSIFGGMKKLSPKLARYAMLMSNYQYTIVHTAGIQNGGPDGMSRRMYNYSRTKTDDIIDNFPETLGLDHIWTEDITPPEPIAAVTRAAHKLQASEKSQPTIQPHKPPQTDRLKSTDNRNAQTDTTGMQNKQTAITHQHQALGSDASFADLFTPEQIRSSQLADEFCGDMIRWLEEDITPANRERETRCRKREYDYCIKNGMLFHIWEPIPNQGDARLRLVLPKTLQGPVIRHEHTSRLSCHLVLRKQLESSASDSFSRDCMRQYDSSSQIVKSALK